MTDGAPCVAYIGAHDVDYAVRAGGTLARYAAAGSRVVALSLTRGEKRESGRLWDELPDATLEAIARTKAEEMARCAEVIGCELVSLEWGDAPIVFDEARLLTLARFLQEVRPDIVITHAREETNRDHHETRDAVLAALQLANTEGVAAEHGLPMWAPAATYFSEPGFPVVLDFVPNVWVDITDVWPVKLEALRLATSHGILEDSYGRCAEYRGYQARRLAEDDAIVYAEAFTCDQRWIGDRLPFERKRPQ